MKILNGVPIHITKDGKAVPLDQLSEGHLENIISKLSCIARDGIRVRTHFIVDDFNDMYTCQDKTLYGEEALEHLDYKWYVEERERRTKSKSGNKGKHGRGH